MQTIPIKLPLPHAKQAEFMNASAKRRVIVAGRRGGKTTGAAVLAVTYALRGRRVLEAAPTADQTSAFWDRVVKYCKPFVDHKAASINKTHRSIELYNGGYIRCKTAWNADTLRGDYADLLILDEYSIMNPDAWTEVGAPMLLDNDGDAVFIFTPKRKNHAFRLYGQAMTDTTARWGAWHFTSFDNPHLSKPALAEITSDMGNDAYRQEIMAEFLESEGAVFRGIDACCILKPSTPQEHDGHRIVFGADWGKQDDSTSISIGCADCRRELLLDRFNQVDYTFQEKRVVGLYNTWKPAMILAEHNSIGDPIISHLHNLGLPIVPFDTTASSKPPLIENLSLSIETREIMLLDDPIGKIELESYERRVSGNTGRSTYSAPEGMHDDTIMARALMARAMERNHWYILGEA